MLDIYKTSKADVYSKIDISADSRPAVASKLIISKASTPGDNSKINGSMVQHQTFLQTDISTASTEVYVKTDDFITSILRKSKFFAWSMTSLDIFNTAMFVL